MQNDITQTTTTDFQNDVADYSVDTATTDGVTEQEETIIHNNDFTKWFGYYTKIPEVKKPIDNYATWVVGKGFTTDTRTQVLLENITGQGEDTFLSIMRNLLIVKKVNKASYAEVIRNDKGTLINLKPLDPLSMQTILNQKGMIVRHEQLSKTKGKKPQTFKPEKILYMVNDRVADDNGRSVIEACEWLILARNQLMADMKRISHLSSVRILYVEENDKARLSELKTELADGIEKGNVVIFTVKPGEAKFEDLTLPPIEAFLAQIRYYENAFYKAIGFPKSLTGDSEGVPESGGKMAYLNHEPIYNWEVTELEADLWNQLAIKVKFEKQASLTDSMNDTENKSINQTQASQPGDTQI